MSQGSVPTVLSLGFMLEYSKPDGEPRPVYFPLMVGSGTPLFNSLVMLFQRTWLGYSGTDKPVPAIHVFQDTEDFDSFVSKVSNFVPHLVGEVVDHARYVPGLTVRFLAIDPACLGIDD